MGNLVPDDHGLRTPARHDGYAPIQDYAVIGNKRSAALVALDGSIDWLCLPRFDNPSVFGALLDPQLGGRWTLQPEEPFRAERSYIEGTSVLQTTFETDGGTVRVTDAMTRGAARPVDWNELPRRIECLDGEITMRWRVEPRFDFKGLPPAIEHEDASSFVLRSSDLNLTLQTWDCGDAEIRSDG